jgi:hypothetical protein
MVRLDRKGQAVTEYALLLLIVVSSYLFLVRGLMDAGIAQLFIKPLKGDYARVYQFGHTKGEFDGASGKNHPRFDGAGDNNFRIFLNPEPQ